METACGGRCSHAADHSLRVLQYPHTYNVLGLSGGASRRFRSKAFKQVMQARDHFISIFGTLETSVVACPGLCPALDVVTAYELL